MLTIGSSLCLLFSLSLRILLSTHLLDPPSSPHCHAVTLVTIVSCLEIHSGRLTGLSSSLPPFKIHAPESTLPTGARAIFNRTFRSHRIVPPPTHPPKEKKTLRCQNRVGLPICKWERRPCIPAPLHRLLMSRDRGGCLTPREDELVTWRVSGGWRRDS